MSLNIDKMNEIKGNKQKRNSANVRNLPFDNSVIPEIQQRGVVGMDEQQAQKFTRGMENLEPNFEVKARSDHTVVDIKEFKIENQVFTFPYLDVGMRYT